MKLLCWNVNSIRARWPRLKAVLARHAPDVACLQETKVVDQDFPTTELRELGYCVEAYGGRGYNGVALLSREPPADVRRGFPGDPAHLESRVISAVIGGVRVINLYVVNGQSLGSAKYELKLSWLDALTRWLSAEFEAEQPLALCGDFNIAPDDRDVYDPTFFRQRLLCSEAERARLVTLQQWGLRDLLRLHHPGAGTFSWWDYRAGAFRRNLGLRIDLVLGTAPLAARSASVEIDRAERDPRAGEGKPSDHAPVIAVWRDA